MIASVAHRLGHPIFTGMPNLSRQDEDRIAVLRRSIADTFVRIGDERAQVRLWQKELNDLLDRKRTPRNA
jgi:hypothetical protein